MRKFLLSSFIILSVAHAQTPVIQWQRCFGSPDIDQCRGVTKLPDGGVVAVGVSAMDGGDVTGNHGSGDMWVMRTDESGNLLWQKSIGGNGGDAGDCVIINSEGHIIVTGTTYTPNNGDVTGNHGTADLWMVRIDTSGNFLQAKCFGGSSTEFGNSVCQTPDGGYLVAGIVNSANGDVTGQHGGGDGWLLKMDSLWNLQWSHCYGGSKYDGFNQVLITSDGNYLCVGFSMSDDGDVTDHRGDSLTMDSWVVMTDAAGNLLWQKSFGGSDNDMASGVAETTQHQFLLAAMAASNDSDVTGNHGGQDLWLVKFDSAGIIWQKCFGGTSVENGLKILANSDSGITVFSGAGSLNGDVTGGHGSNDYWLIHTDTAGNILWDKCFGGSQWDIPNEGFAWDDSTFMLAGWTFSTNGDITFTNGNEDYWLVKVRATLLTSASETPFSSLLPKFYPNPSNGWIKFLLEESTRFPFQITIRDMMGKELKSFIAENESSYDLDLAVGCYLVEIKNENGISSCSKLMICE